VFKKAEKLGKNKKKKIESDLGKRNEENRPNDFVKRIKPTRGRGLK